MKLVAEKDIVERRLLEIDDPAVDEVPDKIYDEINLLHERLGRINRELVK
jgi:hypothetical protein